MEASDYQPDGQFPAFVGRNEVVCVLGEGGMARVFLAIQRNAFDATKLVVVKQLRPEFSADQEFLEMFMDEARLSLRFSHPNVVHTYEVSAEAPEYALIMEYLEGQTLAQLVRRAKAGSLPLDAQIWILTQVLAGLAYAHGLTDFDGTPLDIVHRDVSPSNVFITSSGEVKLLDFGIAKATGAISFTRQGIVKGKIGYASPEQFLGQPIDARCDLYSVGVMLWEAIAGRRRTSSKESQLSALRARIDNVEPAIETIVPNVAPELADACRRALAYEPSARWPSALEFQRCLQSYLDLKPQQNWQEITGGVLREYFARDLANVRQALEARMSARSSQQPPVTGRFSTGAAGAVAKTEASDLHESPAFRPRVSASLRRWGLPVAGAVGVGLFGLWNANRGEAETPQARAAAAASPAAAPASSVDAARAAPAARSRIHIEVSPQRATLTLDGREIDNPYQMTLPVDEREHRLVVTAKGYETEEHVLRFDRDLELRVSLSSIQDRASPRARGRVVPSPDEASPPPAPRAAAEPKLSPKTSSERAAESLEPGAEIRRTNQKVAPELDEKDPYSK